MVDCNHRMALAVALLLTSLSLLIGSPAWCEKPPKEISPTYGHESIEQLLQAAPSIEGVLPQPEPVARPQPEEPVGEQIVEPVRPLDLRAPVEVAAAPPVSEKYKVWIYQKSGDTLWRIAEKVYGDRTKWPLIYAANKDIVKDPNKIYPKQVLKIPPSDWQP
jgi:nucleoid-associated protein YgaU